MPKGDSNGTKFPGEPEKGTQRDELIENMFKASTKKARKRTHVHQERVKTERGKSGKRKHLTG
jgi:hypothetical protein